MLDYKKIEKMIRSVIKPLALQIKQQNIKVSNTITLPDPTIYVELLHKHYTHSDEITTITIPRDGFLYGRLLGNSAQYLVVRYKKPADTLIHIHDSPTGYTSTTTWAPVKGGTILTVQTRISDEDNGSAILRLY